jgi:hypothetical protein
MASAHSPPFSAFSTGIPQMKSPICVYSRFFRLAARQKRVSDACTFGVLLTCLCTWRRRRTSFSSYLSPFGDPLQSRGDINAVAHQVAVTLLDHVAEMDADAEFDTALGGQSSIALDHAVLHFNGAAHGIDHAAEVVWRELTSFWRERRLTSQ